MMFPAVRLILASVALGAAMSLLAQGTVCLAETQGLSWVPNTHECCPSGSSEDAPSDLPSSPDSQPCSHGQCHHGQALWIAVLPLLFSPSHTGHSPRPTNDPLPDSLSRDIHQPPQIA